MKQIFEATISFKVQYEKTDLFGLRTRNYVVNEEVSIPYYFYCDSMKNAEKEIKQSMFWSNEVLGAVAEQAYDLQGTDYVVENKKIVINLVRYPTIKNLEEFMLAPDYFEYANDWMSEKCDGETTTTPDKLE